ncbi:MAG: hypothetical protein ACTSV1_07520 [Alphaproteobacteria bacterium]
MVDAVVFEKEMGISHDEFFRNIARALPGIDFQRTNNGVSVEDSGRRLDIVLDDEGERRIALMRVPITRVRLTFRGYGDADIARILESYDRAFQRGGG